MVANTRVKVRKASSLTGAAMEAWREVTARVDVGKGGAYWKILDDGWYDVQGHNSIKKFWLEEPLEFWLETPHTKTKLKRHVTESKWNLKPFFKPKL